MRRGLIICALAAAALLTAACGGGAGNALQSVASAATKTAGTQSAKFHMDLAETVGPVGPLHFTADGVSDNASHSADMTMDLSSIATLAGQAGSPDQWKAHLILDGSGASPVLYLQLPAIDKYLNGKTWVKADIGALAKQAGTSITQLLQTAGSQDPTKALQMLESIGNVTKVGTATIDGVDTTEYSGTVDVKKVASLLGAQAKALDRAKISSIPIDVWIGSDGLVRRLHEHLAYGQTTTDLTVDLSDFGVQTSIQAPPADQTVDVSTLKGIGA
jgi:LppX_LprAFG lipoprotein